MHKTRNNGLCNYDGSLNKGTLFREFVFQRSRDLIIWRVLMININDITTLNVIYIIDLNSNSIFIKNWMTNLILMFNVIINVNFCANMFPCVWWCYFIDNVGINLADVLGYHYVILCISNQHGTNKKFWL